MWIIFLNIKPTFKDAFSAARNLGYKIFGVVDSTGLADTNLYDGCEVVAGGLSLDLIMISIEKHGIPLNQIGLVWTIQDQLVPLAAAVNDELKIKSSYSLSSSWKTKSKFQLRQSLEHTSLNPRYCVVDARSEEIPNVDFEKYVVKPAIGHSSIGVEVGDNVGALPAILQRSKSCIDELGATIPVPAGLEFGTNDTSLIIIEEFILGEEYAVDILVSNDDLVFSQICSKSPMESPYFEEKTYVAPADCTERTRQLLLKATIGVIRTLGIHNGLAHVEFIVNDSGAYLLDIGLRLGGGGLSHDLAKISTGRNLVESTLAVLLDVERPDPGQVDENICLLYLHQVNDGGEIVELPSGVGFTPGAGIEICETIHFTEVDEVLKPYPAYSGLPGFSLFKIFGRSALSYRKLDSLIAECDRHLSPKFSSKIAGPEN